MGDMKAKLPIVVLGSGYAGTLAALRLSRSTEHPITLVSPDGMLTERIRLHERAVRERTISHPLTRFVAKTRVQIEQGFVRHIDRSAKTVLLDNRTLRYEKLVVAVGSSAPKPLYDTHDLPSLSGAIAMQSRWKACKTLVVVGGGLTGIEYAAEIAETYAPTVNVVLATRSLAGELSNRAQTHIRTVLRALGVTVLEQRTVLAINELSVRTDSETVECDRVLITTGMEGLPLLKDSGFTVNSQGFALVDPMLRSVDDPDVYIVGDAAQLPLKGSAGCKTAMPMAAHAATNIALSLSNRDHLPFSYRDAGHCVSLGRREAVIQMADRTGSPSNSIVTGKLAVILKECVCRFTVMALAAERRGFAYRWLPSPPQLSYSPAPQLTAKADA